MSDERELRDSPAPSVDRQISLQVGERRFVTTAETLISESGFFASLLSGRWDNIQKDGSYFVDADGGLFEHVLRYLRRGVFPVFYDKIKGHHHHLYLALLEEAKYFQIRQLEEWLEKKQYLYALKIRYSATDVEGTQDLQLSRSTNMDLEFYPEWGSKKMYICPRGIYVHRGNPNACGRDCRRAQGDADDIYEEEPVLRVLVVEKQIVFDTHACLSAGEKLLDVESS
jgi:BTB/POZ domain-containing protein KCTD9